jgi:hypothetical protein
MSAATALALFVAAPMTIAGGDLDPAFPGADIYVGTPRSAPVPPGRGCAVAARYVELVNAGDYAGVAALYADDATFLEPMRPNLRGRAQIDEFYTRRIGAMKPRIVAVSYLGNDAECMVALANRIPLGGEQRFALVSVDHFVIGADGRIASMVAFARPARE